MAVCYRISLAIASALAGGSVVGLNPAAVGGFSMVDCVFAAVGLGDQRLDGQDRQVVRKGHLIEMPVKQGFDD